jgi:uncharacterized protein YaaN involved in tellurite resistance
VPGSGEGSDAIRTLGAEAQAGLSRLGQALAALSREDPGDALAAARSGVAVALRDLDAAGRELGTRPRWWRRLGGAPQPARGYLQAVDRAAVEVDRLAEALWQEEERLWAQLRSREALYEQAMRLARDLEEQIATGTERLDGDAGADDDVRDALERRLHDLRLTRVVLGQTVLAMQSAIEADRLVARRVATILRGVVPAWDAQTAALVAAARAAPGRDLSVADLGRLRAASAVLLASIADEGDLADKPGAIWTRRG